MSTGLSSNYSRGGTAYYSAYSQAQVTGVAFPNRPVFFPIPGVSRNALTGPRYQALDATVTKSFGIPNRYLGERTGIEFRMDTFNVLNNTNLSPNINSNIDNPNFGVSGGGLAGRQVQLQARLSF